MHAFEALINLHGALLAREDLEARVGVHTGKARVRDDLAAPVPAAPPAVAAAHPADKAEASEKLPVAACRTKVNLTAEGAWQLPLTVSKRGKNYKHPA